MPEHEITIKLDIPAKVKAAFNYLGYCEAVRAGRGQRGGPGIPRELSRLQTATENAALDMLRNWFNGELELEERLSLPTPVMGDDWNGEDEDDADEEGESRNADKPWFDGA